MATPLIRIPQEQGGTMYAFASAAKDLTKAYYNPDLNFEYSKFALLNLPSIDCLTQVPEELQMVTILMVMVM